MAKTDWDSELDARLTTLWAEGHTATVIASKMGMGLTKNAILGRAHRIGLYKRPSLTQRNSSKSGHTTKKRIRRAVKKIPKGVKTVPTAPSDLASNVVDITHRIPPVSHMFPRPRLRAYDPADEIAEVHAIWQEQERRYHATVMRPHNRCEWITCDKPYTYCGAECCIIWGNRQSYCWQHYQISRGKKAAA
jgi:hypothetical protein